MSTRTRRIFGPSTVTVATSTDLYTCPADRTALFHTLTVTNLDGGAVAKFQLGIVLSGASRRFWQSDVAIGATVVLATPVVLNPGEVLAILKTQGTSINVVGFGALLIGVPA